MKRVHVFYSGHVQGVGFRYSVQDIAMTMGVTGWVKNLEDRRVEVVAEGEQVVAGGVINDGLFDFALDLKGNAHTINRKAVNEIGGAIQGVNDPDVVGVG